MDTKQEKVLASFFTRKCEDKYNKLLVDVIEAEEILKYAKDNLLEYIIYQTILESDINYIYPYIIVSKYNISYDRVTNFTKNNMSQSYRIFLSKDLRWMRKKFGSLVCPIYSDSTNGIHNKDAFSDECVNDLFEYWLANNNEFLEFISELEFNELGLPKNCDKSSIGNLEKYPDVRRKILLDFLLT